MTAVNRDAPFAVAGDVLFAKVDTVSNEGELVAVCLRTYGSDQVMGMNWVAALLIVGTEVCNRCTSHVDKFGMADVNVNSTVEEHVAANTVWILRTEDDVTARVDDVWHEIDLAVVVARPGVVVGERLVQRCGVTRESDNYSVFGFARAIVAG